MKHVEDFLETLKKSPPGPLFNPWYDRDLEHDATEAAPDIRRSHLLAYLSQRRNARFLLVAEALGYQGGHFTGIAMTSERILLGHHEKPYGVRPDHVIREWPLQRTSRRSVRESGMSEPTATIVWRAVLELGLDPFDVVLWNALPWHPYHPERGLLSNRTPTAEELEAGRALLPQFLALFPNAVPVAVGRKCEQLMEELSIPHTAVRHPANGGATKFRTQLAAWADSMEVEGVSGSSGRSGS